MDYRNLDHAVHEEMRRRDEEAAREASNRHARNAETAMVWVMACALSAAAALLVWIWKVVTK